MKTFKIVYAPTARSDLSNLFDHLAEQASERLAQAYVDRIMDACESLANAPYRGTKREDIGPECRTVGFERRATILFEVEAQKTRVTILAVLYGGRQIRS